MAPPEGGTADLATIMQTFLEVMKDHEERIAAIDGRLTDLDKEIHEDFFGPIHSSYMAKRREDGIAGLKGKFGKTFEGITPEQFEALGVKDLFGELYDELEKIKEGGGIGEGKDFASDDDWVNSIRDKAMHHINLVMGKKEAKEEKAEPAAEAKTEEKEEPKGTAVEVKVEKKAPEKAPEKAGDKLKAGRKKMKGLLDGY